MMTSETFHISAVALMIVGMLATSVVQANQYNLTFKTDYKGDEKLHIQIERPEALACQIKACPHNALEKLTSDYLYTNNQPIRQYASSGNTTHGAGYLSANIAINDQDYLLYPGNEQANQFRFVNGRFLTQNSDKNFDGCLRIRSAHQSLSPMYIDIAYMHPRYLAQAKPTYSEDCSKFRIRIGNDQVERMVNAIQFDSVSVVFQIEANTLCTTGQCLHASVVPSARSLSREEISQCDKIRLAKLDFNSYSEFQNHCKRSIYGIQKCEVGPDLAEQEFFIKLTQQKVIGLLNQYCPAPPDCE